MKRQGTKRQKSWQQQQLKLESSCPLPHHADAQHSAPHESPPHASDLQPQHSVPEHSGTQHSGPELSGQEPDQAMKQETMNPPPPMPVRVAPGSRPATANGAPMSACQIQQQQHLHQQDEKQQHQQSQSQPNHQQQQQSSGTAQQASSSAVEAAAQAAERFQRSVKQQEVHAVPGGGLGQGNCGAVGLQGCLRRFVRPEMLSKWTCGRSAAETMFMSL